MSELDTKQEKNVSSDSDSDFKLRIFNEKLTVIFSLEEFRTSYHTDSVLWKHK